jgi:hypothetical protein
VDGDVGFSRRKAGVACRRQVQRYIAVQVNQRSRCAWYPYQELLRHECSGAKRLNDMK